MRASVHLHFTEASDSFQPARSSWQMAALQRLSSNANFYDLDSALQRLIISALVKRGSRVHTWQRHKGDFSSPSRKGLDGGRLAEPGSGPETRSPSSRRRGPTGNRWDDSGRPEISLQAQAFTPSEGRRAQQRQRLNLSRLARHVIAPRSVYKKKKKKKVVFNYLDSRAEPRTINNTQASTLKVM